MFNLKNTFQAMEGLQITNTNKCSFPTSYLIPYFQSIICFTYHMNFEIKTDLLVTIINHLHIDNT